MDRWISQRSSHPDRTHRVTDRTNTEAEAQKHTRLWQPSDARSVFHDVNCQKGMKLEWTGQEWTKNQNTGFVKKSFSCSEFVILHNQCGQMHIIHTAWTFCSPDVRKHGEDPNKCHITETVMQKWSQPITISVKITAFLTYLSQKSLHHALISAPWTQIWFSHDLNWCPRGREPVFAFVEAWFCVSRQSHRAVCLH